jgi:predicted nucleotidyltransferase
VFADLPCQDESSGLRVDFILSFTPYEREAIARAVPVTLGGSTVRFATAEDLIVHKVLAGRPRDLEDVKGVLWKNPILDVRAVRDTLAAMGEAIDQSLAARFDEILALGRGSRP